MGRVGWNGIGGDGVDFLGSGLVDRESIFDKSFS
jgi:hypothetical protein